MIDLTWVIKIDQEPGGSRWRVNLWFANPPAWVTGLTKEDPTRVVFKWEREARDWAEAVATSFEMNKQPWAVDEGSL